MPQPGSDLTEAEWVDARLQSLEHKMRDVRDQWKFAVRWGPENGGTARISSAQGPTTTIADISIDEVLATFGMTHLVYLCKNATCVDKTCIVHEPLLVGAPVRDGLPRRFILRRLEDVHDFTGPGVVCWGVEFPDGTVAYRWNSNLATTVIASKASDVEAIHGHDGKTVLEWIDAGVEGTYGVQP